MTIKQMIIDKCLELIIFASMALFVITSTMLAGKHNRQIQELNYQVANQQQQINALSDRCTSDGVPAKLVGSHVKGL